MSAAAPPADATTAPPAPKVEAFELPRPMLTRGIDWVIRACGEAMTFIWVALICLILYVVFNRYVLGITSTFNEELMRALFAIGWLVGLSYAITADRHVRIDLVSERLSPVTRGVIEFLGIGFLLIPFALWGALGAYSFVEFYFLNGDASNSPGGLEEVWRVRLMMIIGFGLILVAAYARFIAVCLFLARRGALLGLLAILACLGLAWAGVHSLSDQGVLGQVTAEGLAEAAEEIADLREDIAEDIKDATERLPTAEELDRLIAAYRAEETVPAGARERDVRELIAFIDASERYRTLDTQTAPDPLIPGALLLAALVGILAVAMRLSGVGGLVLPGVLLVVMLALSAYGIVGARDLDAQVVTAVAEIPDEDEYARDFAEAAEIRANYVAPWLVALASASLVVGLMVLAEALGLILAVLRSVRVVYLLGGIAAGLGLGAVVYFLNLVSSDVAAVLDALRAAAIAGDAAAVDAPQLDESQRFRVTQMQQAPAILINLMGLATLLAIGGFVLALLRRGRPGLWIAMGAVAAALTVLVLLLGQGLLTDLSNETLLAAAPTLETARLDMLLALEIATWSLVALIIVGSLAMLVAYDVDLFACALVSLAAAALVLREVGKFVVYYANDTRTVIEEGRYEMLPVLAEITALFVGLSIIGYGVIWMIGWLARHSYEVEPPSTAKMLVDPDDVVDPQTRETLHRRMEASSTP